MVLTHDLNSMIGHAWDRVRLGRAMPGVIAASTQLPIGLVITELELLVEASEEGEWESQVLFVSAG